MVRQLFHIILSLMAFIAGMFLGQSTVFAADASCRCEEFKCDPCEIQTGITFYTEKCEGNQTKSCQKPQCTLKKDLPKSCAHRAPQTIPVADGAPSEFVQAEAKPAVVEDRKSVGAFFIVRGDVKLLSDGKELAPKVGTTVFEKDVVVTGDDGNAKIIFTDKNTVNITPSSRLKIRGFEGPELVKNSTTTLDLIYGKVRSQIVTKPRSAAKPCFMIRTPAAVAGVRGTDFIVTHTKGGDITKVETLHGIVELGGHSTPEKTLVKKGQYASYVVLASNDITPQTISDDSIGSWTQRGFLTPTYKLSDEQIETLDIATNFQDDGSDRIVANVAKNQPEKSLCGNPKGEFNQCLWVCVNNPSGESKCRTDLQGTRCMRKKCDANGRWAHEERVPAAEGSVKCEAHESVVGPCDY